MNLKTLLVQLSDCQAPQLMNDLDSFFRVRAHAFREYPKQHEEIRSKIDALSGQVPDKVKGLFFEIDETYGELMAAQNAAIYKQGFAECLQMVLSISDNQLIDLLKQRGDH